MRCAGMPLLHQNRIFGTNQRHRSDQQGCQKFFQFARSF